MGISDYLRQSTTFTAHAAKASEFYAGSRLLQPFAESSGIQLDQINLVVTFILSLVLAIIFRLLLSKANVALKHLVEFLSGVGLLYFCYGHHVLFAIWQAIICYIVMRFGPRHNMHIVCFGFSFVCLSIAHISRLIYDYAGYTLDIALPMMMLTQRLTSLAFSLHDGFTPDINSLTPDQRFLAVQRFPNLLEFFSYAFYFQSIICGPFVHYADYISFIEGRNWTRFSVPSLSSNDAVSSAHTSKNARPSNEIVPVRVQLLHGGEQVVINPLTSHELLISSMIAGLRSLAIAVFCGALLIFLSTIFPMQRLTDPEFLKQPIFYKTAFILGFISATRQRYFFAWKFSDSINVFSGLSYSGVSKEGKALWLLTNNVDIKELELGTRFAGHINAWNKTTTDWLRFMIYDRTPWHPTLMTFSFSALWHGFYPGYYITFLTAVLFLHAVRVVRSTLRPLCELHPALVVLYEVVAFVLVRLASAYMTLPFLVMTLTASYQVTSSLNYWMHILAVVVILTLSRLRRFLPESLRSKHIYGRARSQKEGEAGHKHQNITSEVSSNGNGLANGYHVSHSEKKYE